jgi:hypothetical protein
VYVCVCVCLCVYVCVNVCICMFVCLFVYVCLYVYVYVLVCMYVCVLCICVVCIRCSFRQKCLKLIRSEASDLKTRRTRSRSAEYSLWKGLGTCCRTEYGKNE